MPADPHHDAMSLTKPQQRMLRAALYAEETHGMPVRPWGSQWRSFTILEGLQLVTLAVQGDENTGHRFHARLTEAGRQWAQMLRNLGKPDGV